MSRDPDDERVQLTQSPDKLTGNEGVFSAFPREFVIMPQDRQHAGPPNLHPYTRPLTISDTESSVAMDAAAFANPGERASREKVKYRLTKCGELCLGIFSTVVPGSGIEVETMDAGRQVETGRKDGAISVLLGHILGTKTSTPVTTDASMDFPHDWESDHPAPSELGHQEVGRTIVLHSVAVSPQFQGRGLGRILMLAYMQHMNGAGIADRLVLIAHDHMIPWYESLGFVDKGESACQIAGGGWHDMEFELKALEPQTAYG